MHTSGKVPALPAPPAQWSTVIIGDDAENIARKTVGRGRCEWCGLCCANAHVNYLAAVIHGKLTKIDKRDKIINLRKKAVFCELTHFVFLQKSDS